MFIFQSKLDYSTICNFKNLSLQSSVSPYLVVWGGGGGLVSFLNINAHGLVSQNLRVGLKNL